ncbi:MAG: hypothetical protein AAGC81_11630 [Pseudomonadota bacterium]
MDLENTIEVVADTPIDLTEDISSAEEGIPSRLAHKNHVPPRRTSVLIDDFDYGARAEFETLMIVPGREGVVQGERQKSWSAGCDEVADAPIAAERQISDVASRLKLDTSLLVSGGVKSHVLSREVATVPIRGNPDADGIISTFRILTAALRKRPGCLIVMRPLRHLWPLTIAMKLGLRLVVVAETPESFDILSKGLMAWPFQNLNKDALRRCEGILVNHSITSEKLRRIGVRPEDIFMVHAQFADCLAHRGRNDLSNRTLKSVVIIWQGGDADHRELLRKKVREIEHSFPQVKIEIINQSSELGSSRQAAVDHERERLFGDGGEPSTALLRGADLVVLWPQHPSETKPCDGALRALVAGVPVLADHCEILPDWISPAVKRGPLMQRAGLRKAIARLIANPAHLRRMHRAAGEVANGFFDRQSSLASQLFGLLTR